MKLLFTLASICFCAMLLAFTINTPYENMYSGESPDIKYSPGGRRYWFITDATLGRLAQVSDKIGIGTIVTNRGLYHAVLRIDNAFVGCTNNEELVVVYEGGIQYGYPTNHSQIVFSVHSNFWSHFRSTPEWHMAFRLETPSHPSTNYWFTSANRSWFYPDRDNGLLLGQFTNIIQNTRIQPNWTNYYHALRSGLSSPSARVREDAFWDLRYLAIQGTKAHCAAMEADPLLPEAQKEMLRYYLEKWDTEPYLWIWKLRD